MTKSISEILESQIICPNCDGLGKHNVQDVNMLSDNQSEICRLCEGTGYLTNSLRALALEWKVRSEERYEQLSSLQSTIATCLTRLDDTRPQPPLLSNIDDDDRSFMHMLDDLIAAAFAAPRDHGRIVSVCTCGMYVTHPIDSRLQHRDCGGKLIRLGESDYEQIARNVFKIQIEENQISTKK